MSATSRRDPSNVDRAIPRRYRGVHPAWGIGLVVAVPVVMFGLAYAFSWLPRLAGLSPSDAELRGLIDREGAALVAQVNAFRTEQGRYPASLTELGRAPSEWTLLRGSSGHALTRAIGPSEVLEYVFDPPPGTGPTGWYRRSEAGRPKLLRPSRDGDMPATPAAG